MHPLAAALERSPELFPQGIDLGADTANLVRLSEAEYAAASFLDDRVLTRHTVGRSIAIPELEAAVADTHLNEHCDFIFHIGHVGSTLLSRLLGTHPAVFPLREPSVLRVLAQMRAEPERQPRIWEATQFDSRLTCFLKLLSRTFRPEQRANIKTTSFVSEMAAEILARPGKPRAVFLFVPVETYLATIFGGPNSRQEARALAASRLKRVHSRIGEALWQVADLSEGETIAMSWICEMSALVAASEAAKDRALWLNFDHFLEEPAQALASAFHHLGIEAKSDEIGAMLSGPELRRYSKAPAYAYDAAQRHEILRQARTQDAPEISRGMRWLEHAAATVPIIQPFITALLQHARI